MIATVAAPASDRVAPTQSLRPLMTPLARAALDAGCSPADVHAYLTTRPLTPWSDVAIPTLGFPPARSVGAIAASLESASQERTV